MKIKESTEKIQKQIEKIILRQVYEKLKRIAPLIRQDIIDVNLELWKSTETYNSLLYGDLTHELGFPEGQAQRMVDAILDRISESIAVVPRLPRRKNTGNQMVMGFRIVTKSLPGIEDMPEAEIDTGKDTVGTDFANDFAAFGATAISRKLPWVNWLLFRGNQYIIFNYEYVPIASERSRSGKGLMVYDDSENWKVPGEFSGTRNSNWITRTLTENTNYLTYKYCEIINKYMDKTL